MQDAILLPPGWLLNDNIQPPETVTVIFFITGNPGLISYYNSFLRLLSEGAGKNAIVAGASLAGFGSVSGLSAERDLASELFYPPGFERKPIYDLQDQIKLSYHRLDYLVESIRKSYSKTADLPFRVTLLGHSVGAYIALEVVRLKHEQSVGIVTQDAITYSIAATILLTPTVQNISHSLSGKIATPVLSTLPFFPSLLQLGASTLAYSLPMSWLENVVSTVTGMKVQDALQTTVSFLAKPGAVKQALHLARCEMLEIGEDKWTEEVWGAVEAIDVEGTTVANQAAHKWKAPKHYFLFAKEDHWVADSTRDSIVKSVGTRGTVMVDEDGKMGLGHAWCLEQNELVAGIVNDWIAEVVRS